MLIVAIAWMYVVILMSATQPTWLAALGTLFFYGLFPLSIVLYLMATPARRQRRLRQESAREATRRRLQEVTTVMPENAEQATGSDTQHDNRSPR